MIQKRICCYFTANCRHPRSTLITFLDLPEDVRDRIYGEAGLPQDSLIRIFGPDYPYGLIDEFSSRDSVYYTIAFCLRTKQNKFIWAGCNGNEDSDSAEDLFYNLSLTNSIIGEDATRCLLSRTRILFCADGSWSDLSILQQIPAAWTRWIRVLNLHVNPGTPARQEWAEGYPCYHFGCICHTEPPTLSTASFNSFISFWPKVAARLREIQRAGKQPFKLVCDLENGTDAQSMIKILQEYDISTTFLRLGYGPDPVLRELARQEVRRTSNAGLEPLRFLDLPVELRRLVLGFTDLVTPLQEVMCQLNGKFRSPHEPGEPDEGPGEHCDRRVHCSVVRAAYPPCNCWRPPIPLFLVCKEFLEEARDVFFGLNRFIAAVDLDPDSCEGGKTFADGIGCLNLPYPEEMLPRLRSLEILFPVKYALDDAASDMWTRSVQFLSSRVTRLKLRLYLSHFLDEVNEDEYWTETQEKMERAFRVHQEFVRPFATVDGLVDCFAHTLSPWQTLQVRDPLIREQLSLHEKQLETLVMGKTYDSIARGKLEQNESRWRVDPTDPLPWYIWSD